MAADSSDSNQEEHFDADFKKNFNKDMLAMLNKGSPNDVRILLRDGEITANKDVLAARCEYFAANFRWKEETKDDSDIVEITDCSKKVMERIIQYLFTGSIKFKDLGILQLLELFNQVRKLLLKSDLLVLIESYMKDMLVSTIRSQSNTKYAEIILALQNADKFALEGVSREFIFRTVLFSLPLIAKDAVGIRIFPTLPLHIIKELFSFPQTERIFSKRYNQRILNSAKFRCFLAWKQGNKDTSQEEKKKILGTIDLDLFHAIELYQLVKPSGLFPEDEVEKRIVKCLRERDEMISQKERNDDAN